MTGRRGGGGGGGPLCFNPENDEDARAKEEPPPPLFGWPKNPEPSNLRRADEEEMENATSGTQFVLLGFLSHTKLATISFALILAMFIVTLLGNSLLLMVTQVDVSLQTPMYFFLGQLSFVDMCQVLVIVPKAAKDFVTQQKTISLMRCAAQIFLTLNLGGAECLLLAVMSYDRYVAICQPLNYLVLMRKKICVVLSAGAWILSFHYALIKAVYLLPLTYCGSNMINHFFCEFDTVIGYSCSDTSTFEKVSLLLGSSLLLLFPFSVIVTSYIAILLQILRARRSGERSHKALGTCLSHLCVVGIFYGSAILRHLKLRSYYSGEMSQIFSLFCTIFTSTVNPFIYSLRNRDVVAALRKLCRS
ncbi:olfactory receptor 2M5-like [Varanus komodoensis]|uniref:olfactory receptor 2M5-like n=1 Tax=Varanus komodoensis TaxID=61221 RepID=UPI001CF7AEC0|nr:olfactory receptor 2M5-like [Varanus komodoensis]